MSQWFITRASGNIADHNIIYHLITDLTETHSVWPRSVGPSLCIPPQSNVVQCDYWDNLIDRLPKNPDQSPLSLALDF